MLERFPEDVFYIILDEIQNRHDLKKLCEVSKILNELTTPRLYEAVFFEASLNQLRGNRFFGIQTVSESSLVHTKHIKFRSRFRDTADRGAYTPQDNEGRSDEIIDLDASYEELSKMLLRLPPRVLQSFSWEMGTSIPPQVLSREVGYINFHQRSLESISLSTGRTADDVGRDETPISLSGLESLRSLSWAGLKTTSDFIALGAALRANSRSLRELRLDFINYDNVEYFLDHDTFPGDNVLTHQILRLESECLQSVLPCLETLSLTGVDFRGVEHELVKALNLHNISTLTLRYCVALPSFLKAISKAGANKLTSFEIACGPSPGTVFDNEQLSEQISALLQASRNLTDLFISVSEFSDTMSFWKEISQSHLPLKRFIYHQRLVYADDVYLRLTSDNLGLSISQADRLKMTSAVDQHPFANLKLECLGIACFESILIPIVAPFTASHNLKILHIRRSGMDSVRSKGEGLHNVLNIYESGIASWHPYKSSNRLSVEWRRCSRSLPDSFDLEASEEEEIRKMLKDEHILVDFANWAFGPQGIPSLQVLAVGDFSYDGLFEKHNNLFCRHAWSIRNPEKAMPDADDDTQAELPMAFRQMRMTDKELWRLVDQNIDFLKACSLDVLIEE